ncbi:MAG: hypothetical protein HN826_03460 [Methylococcales bacterium]|jgi:hypothetical protein|nr:hypothetical protein [Methylococcales bacterium]
MNLIYTLSVAGFVPAPFTNADTSSDIVITGTISEVISVAVTTSDNNFIITPGVIVEDQNIANIAINSNDPDGYTVSLMTNSLQGKLYNVEKDEFLNYTVSYNGNSNVSLSNTPTVVESSITQTSGLILRSLTLTIPAESSVGRSAESYTDTVTVNLTGK